MNFLHAFKAWLAFSISFSIWVDLLEGGSLCSESWSLPADLFEVCEISCKDIFQVYQSKKKKNPTQPKTKKAANQTNTCKLEWSHLNAISLIWIWLSCVFHISQEYGVLGDLIFTWKKTRQFITPVCALMCLFVCFEVFIETCWPLLH